MKFLLLFLFINIFTFSFSQDWLEFRDLKEKEEGFVFTQKGTTITGIIQIKPCNEKIIISKNDSTIKIDPLSIKYINKGSHIIIPKYFNDSFDFYFCEPIDTTQTLKLYKGYYCSNGAGVGLIQAITPTFWHAYILTTDNNDALAFERAKGSFGTVNYKKELKYALTDNKKAMEYLDTFKKIKFEDIPKIVSYINTIY